MKNILLVLCIFFIPFPGLCQDEMDNRIKMITEYGSDIRTIQDMFTFEQIDYYQVKFVGAGLKGKNFYLVMKDLWDGEIIKTDTLVNTSTNERMLPISSDTLNLRVTAKKITDSELKLIFRFPQFGISKTYKATESNDYSLRDVGRSLKIETGKEFSAFAYILPYEKDGWKMWCAVDSSGKDIEKWGKEFGLKHYLIFEMKFD
ncbi:MAG: hypothetical protein KF845_05070 [Cyclobacteriaceae bacterium]|nr:hypothetical protein [Cyclobacteriaceae bacterium]